ncbi:MAG: TetR/AcrR family transcriptional regulator [Myxococcota bacterium]
MNPDSSRGKKPQRLKERLRLATAEAILEAAEQVLLARGLDAPMEQIAESAGVAVGTLYNHFKDRRALVTALLEQHRAKLWADVRAAEERTADAGIREQLTAMLTAMIFAWSKLYLVVKQTELPDAKRRGEIRERFAKLFGPALERARKLGQVRDDPEGVHALALHGLIQSYFTLAIDAPRRVSPERAVELVVGTFLDGVGSARRP